MNLLRLSLFLGCLTLLISGCDDSTGPKRSLAEPPNLVLIIADDMGWNDYGGAGHPSIRTPNLDQLARDGMTFQQAFLTTSSCSPSRSSIITGRYPHNTDAEQLHWPLPGNQITFVEKLREAGYWTGAAGKWHLGSEIRDRFDVILGGGRGDLPIPPRASDTTSGCMQWQRLLQERPKDRPFFTWLAAFDPHRAYHSDIIARPHRPEEAVVPPYLPDLPEMREDLVLYYDEVARLDSFVGVVVQELEAQGVSDNTLILFISDNGRPFPRAKTTLFDSGIRTPFLMKWPSQISGGTTTTSLVSAIDIAPTFLELAGAEIPPTVQGISLLPMLVNPNTKLRQFAFGEHNWHDFDDHSRAVRSERYKYVQHQYHDLPHRPPADAISGISYQAMLTAYEAGELDAAFGGTIQGPRTPEEFFDVENDPFEMHNLANDPTYQAELDLHRVALQEWKAQTQDEVPQFRTADEFDPKTGKPLDNWQWPRPSKVEMVSQGLIPAYEPALAPDRQK
ncbi:MAG: sulfatase [Bacteroidota bacterium]